MLFEYLIILWGLILLYVGTEYLLKGTTFLYLKLEINKAFFGIIFISLCTSLPHLIVFFKTYTVNHIELAYGNILGSNILSIVFIIAIITLNSSNILPSLSNLNKHILIIYNIIFIVLLLFFKLNYIITIILWILLIIKLIKTYNKPLEPLAIISSSDINLPSIILIGTYLIFSILCLIYGTLLLTDGSIIIGKSLNMSEKNIGLSIISITTSLPLISISILLCLRKQLNTALYILVCSNIFNITFVAGIISLVKSFNNGKTFILDSLIFFIILVCLMAINNTKNKTLNRNLSIITLFIYLLYVSYLLIK